MLKEVLHSILLSQQEWLSPEKKEILREQLGKFSSLPPFAYFLTGVRRSGKSTLLKQLMRKYDSLNFFNFEDSRLADFELSDFLTLEELFNLNPGDCSIFFFDEIQHIVGWERYIRDALDRKKTIVITGSTPNSLARN